MESFDSSSLLEPYADVSLLSGLHSALLSACDLARLLLCTSNELRRRLDGFDDVILLLSHREIHGLSALETSALSRHEWRHAALDPSRGTVVRALLWLDRHETALFYANFVTAQLLNEHPSPGEASLRVWRQFGHLWGPSSAVDASQRLPSNDDQAYEEVRRIEALEDGEDVEDGRDQQALTSAHPTLPCAARCFSLSMCHTYPQSAEHFGRGVTCRLAPRPNDAGIVEQLAAGIEHVGLGDGANAGLRPSEVSYYFRLRLNLYGGTPAGRRRAGRQSSVGYFILSDGDPYSPAAQGLFGAECLFLFVLISPNHRATLVAADGNGGTRVVHSDGTHDTRCQSPIA